jgi:hypothetical protein
MERTERIKPDDRMRSPPEPRQVVANVARRLERHKENSSSDAIWWIARAAVRNFATSWLAFFCNHMRSRDTYLTEIGRE